MSILAKHTVGKGGPDKVFKISGMAKARAAEVGKENIVNATTGAFLDGNGKLMTLKTVEAVAKEIPFYESCEYASIEGSAEFIEAVLNGYQSLLIACLPIVFFIGACNMAINIILGAFMNGSLRIGGHHRA